jgi:N-acetylglucosamine-6-phosphate deacetylase
MIVLSGAELVLPDRILAPGTLSIDGDRIADVRAGGIATSALHGHYIVPGLIDVHVHGVEGVDALGDGEAVAAIARLLPRFGVTAFCPTTVACGPRALARVVDQVRRARKGPAPQAARVLPAHLESNFINPEFRGAQPPDCLRAPAGALVNQTPEHLAPTDENFTAADIVREIERGAPDIGIVTLAPELAGSVDLIRWLRERGHHVSLGHSSATYEQALEAIAAGATQATHLFNRMPAVHHRAPGLAGAVLQTDEIAAELICDGVHVHPGLVRSTIAAKRPSRVMAITDATAGAGLPVGARTTLGSRPIVVGESAAHLDDGTLAGSVLTMDRAFRHLVTTMGVPVVDAVTMCATTPARELGLTGYGVIAPGAVADLVVLDRHFSVVQTYIGGRPVYSRR